MVFGDLTATDQQMMEVALAEARAGLAAGGVPVGAALAAGGQLLACGHNERVQSGDPIAHGEMSCLRNAGRQASYQGMTLYTTLSPCQMCSGAILLFQIPRVVVGEATTFAGDLDFLRHRGVDIVLAEDERCIAVMREFQERYPEVWSEDIGGRLQSGFRGHNGARGGWAGGDSCRGWVSGACHAGERPLPRRAGRSGLR